MNRSELKAIVAREGIVDASFTLNGRPRDETYVLEIGEGGWVVYYSERGLRSGEQRFATEDEACRHLLELLLQDETTRQPRPSR